MRAGKRTNTERRGKAPSSITSCGRGELARAIDDVVGKIEEQEADYDNLYKKLFCLAAVCSYRGYPEDGEKVLRAAAKIAGKVDRKRLFLYSELFTYLQSKEAGEVGEVADAFCGAKKEYFHYLTGLGERPEAGAGEGPGEEEEKYREIEPGINEEYLRKGHKRGGKGAGRRRAREERAEARKTAFREIRSVRREDREYAQSLKRMEAKMRKQGSE